MTLFRCDACRADPGGRWVKPAQCIFVDPYRDDKKSPPYRCRSHLSARREEELQARERELGYPIR